MSDNINEDFLRDFLQNCSVVSDNDLRNNIRDMYGNLREQNLRDIESIIVKNRNNTEECVKQVMKYSVERLTANNRPNRSNASLSSSDNNNNNNNTSHVNPNNNNSNGSRNNNNSAPRVGGVNGFVANNHRFDNTVTVKNNELESSNNQQQQQPVRVDLPMDQVPCRNGANCKQDHCGFKHPDGVKKQTECKNGMNCSRPKCYFKHPEGFTAVCIYGDKCNKPVCKFRHAPDFVPMCQKGDQCTDNDCKLRHPETKWCQYGEGCRNPNCTFKHQRLNPFMQQPPPVQYTYMYSAAPMYPPVANPIPYAMPPMQYPGHLMQAHPAMQQPQATRPSRGGPGVKHSPQMNAPFQQQFFMPAQPRGQVRPVMDRHNNIDRSAYNEIAVRLANRGGILVLWDVKNCRIPSKDGIAVVSNFIRSQLLTQGPQVPVSFCFFSNFNLKAHYPEYEYVMTGGSAVNEFIADYLRHGSIPTTAVGLVVFAELNDNVNASIAEFSQRKGGFHFGVVYNETHPYSPPADVLNTATWQVIEKAINAATGGEANRRGPNNNNNPNNNPAGGKRKGNNNYNAGGGNNK